MVREWTSLIFFVVRQKQVDSIHDHFLRYSCRSFGYLFNTKSISVHMLNNFLVINKQFTMSYLLIVYMWSESWNIVENISMTKIDHIVLGKVCNMA